MARLPPSCGSRSNNRESLGARAACRVRRAGVPDRVRCGHLLHPLRPRCEVRPAAGKRLPVVSGTRSPGRCLHRAPGGHIHPSRARGGRAVAVQPARPASARRTGSPGAGAPIVAPNRAAGCSGSNDAEASTASRLSRQGSMSSGSPFTGRSPGSGSIARSSRASSRYGIPRRRQPPWPPASGAARAWGLGMLRLIGKQED